MTDIQIRSFLTVAKTGSFSRAAELLFLSQSSVSRNVNELEKDWGFNILPIYRDKEGHLYKGKVEFCSFEMDILQESFFDGSK